MNLYNKQYDGIVKFHNCYFNDWNIEPHYGINLPVEAKLLEFVNITFTNAKIQTNWHMFNIK